MYHHLIEHTYNVLNGSDIRNVVIEQGGTYSSKTVSTLQVIATVCLQRKETHATVTSHDLPALKSGAWKDFMLLIAPHLEGIIASINKSEHTIYFRNGSVMEFKSFKDEQDAKQGKRHILFVDEADGVPKEVVDMLRVKTELITFIAYNPTSRFWAHDMRGQTDVRFMLSTYKNNQFTPASQIRLFEERKVSMPNWYRVYGEGKTGKIEGAIFNVGEKPLPAYAKLLGYGLDYGYSKVGDPTALVAVWKADGEIWIVEHLYDYNQNEENIHEALINAGVKRGDVIVADTSEGRLNDQLRKRGWNMKDAWKADGSIKYGILLLHGQPLNTLVTCKNVIQEAENYIYNPRTGKPKDEHNHIWDATRYIFTYYTSNGTPQKSKRRAVAQ